MLYVFLGKFFPCSTVLACSIIANIAHKIGCKIIARKIAVFAWNIADYSHKSEVYWKLQDKVSPWFDFYS